MRYEYKCTKCKRPANYVVKREGDRTFKTPIKQCDAPNCGGEVKLMWDQSIEKVRMVTVVVTSLYDSGGYTHLLS